MARSLGNVEYDAEAALYPGASYPAIGMKKTAGKEETAEEQTKQNVSLEETFEQIETIIKQLESPEVTLDDSFRLYQAGVEKIKTCNLLLDTVEKKMQVMQADGSLADFE